MNKSQHIITQPNFGKEERAGIIILDTSRRLIGELMNRTKLDEEIDKYLANEKSNLPFIDELKCRGIEFKIQIGFIRSMITGNIASRMDLIYEPAWLEVTDEG